jgi:hypothetical protein
MQLVGDGEEMAKMAELHIATISKLMRAIIDRGGVCG